MSALTTNSAGESCTSVSIARIYWACVGMRVNIEFDASTNVLAMPLPADSTGDEYYDLFSGIPNNAGSGVTGDIDFTTVVLIWLLRYCLLIQLYPPLYQYVLYPR